MLVVPLSTTKVQASTLSATAERLTNDTARSPRTFTRIVLLAKGYKINDSGLVQVLMLSQESHDVKIYYFNGPPHYEFVPNCWALPPHVSDNGCAKYSK